MEDDLEEYSDGQCGCCKHSAGMYSSEKVGQSIQTVDLCTLNPPVFTGGNPNEVKAWNQPWVLCDGGCSQWEALDHQRC